MIPVCSSIFGPDGASLDRTSFVITESGVFSACARLPTWVRARSTISWLAPMSAFTSSTSGLISLGKRPSRRAALPARTATRPEEIRFSGDSP